MTVPTTYTARAERSGDWWAVSIDDVAGGIHTQGRTVREARRMAADAIAAVLDVPVDTVNVDLVIEGTSAELKQLRTAREAARQAARDEGEALTDAVAALLHTGMSQRDAGDILDLSHQRISQLASAADRKPKRTRKLQGA
ncbi:type II toxin-antitoxin system HicB family antitoxin [Yinghuangia seranimata]|uniref:type II toxin-antitoxin system HicB family antitoxin n=1 Tax=Yinghuangia seranimata TaxID=408067 RepID=UPI00248CD8A2|nr:type II toxin-antitoxin system HicB family antitoxin [Yinghuangia seranimata]MDI2126668.1 type II toxin-antitoxin system HicB family antitoxin [Yinghuangia seranimata]